MRQQARKDILPTGYFDEEKLLVFLADLNNRRDKNYLAFRFCLKNEYEKKLPDGFIYHDNMDAEEIKEILDSQNKVSVIWNAERYKRIEGKLTWWRRILLWLAR